MVASVRRTLRVFSVIGAATAFLALAIVALHTDTGQALDQAALETMSSVARLLPDAAFRPLHSISAATVLAVTAVVALVATLRRRFALAVRIAIVIVGANLTTQLFKTVLLTRPYRGIGYDLANSFPSGHATVVASVVFALIAVTSQRWRSWAALGWSLVGSLILLEVIASGWHRPSDVVAAILIAFVWAMTLVPQEKPQLTSDPINTASLALAGVVSVVLVVAATLRGQALAALVAHMVAGGDVWSFVGDAGIVTGGLAATSITAVVIAAVFALLLGTSSLLCALQSGRKRD